MSNYYDAIAKSYDRLHGEEQIRKIKTVLKHIELTSDDWVIDVGCGTGVSFPYFQPHVEYMVGIDPAAQLLYNCKSTKKPQMIHGWGEHLPQRDGLFDVVVCFTAIHNFTDPEKGIKEMIRVSKPSATIVVTVLKKVKMAPTVCEAIERDLEVVNKIDDLHDHIYICKLKA